MNDDGLRLDKQRHLPPILGLDDTAEGEAWSLRALVHLRMLNGESGWDTDPRFAVGVSYRLGQ